MARKCDKPVVKICTISRDDVLRARRLCERLFPDERDRLHVLEECASRKKDDAGSVALVADLEGRLIGLVCCRVTEDPVLDPGAGHVAWLELIAVDPRYHRRGIATRLWQGMESRLRTRGVSAAWTRSRILGPGVEPIRYPEAVVLLMKLGFVERDNIEDLTADLRQLDFDTGADEQRLRRDGIEIKRIDFSERQELAPFLSAIFPHWTETADSVSEAGPQRVHIARTPDGVIGFAHWAGRWFGPIGVHPDYRLRGIGKVLLLRCLQDMRDLGHEVALIGWANAPFYAKTISAPITRVMYQMQKQISRRKSTGVRT